MGKDKKKKKTSKKPKVETSDVALDDALRTSRKKSTIVPLDQSLKTAKTEQPTVSYVINLVPSGNGVLKYLVFLNGALQMTTLLEVINI